MRRSVTCSSPYQFWETTFPVSGAQAVEYKYMIIDELGNVRAWDGGDNRKIDTSMASFGPVEVRDHWRVRLSTLDILSAVGAREIFCTASVRQ